MMAIIFIAIMGKRNGDDELFDGDDERVIKGEFSPRAFILVLQVQLASVLCWNNSDGFDSHK